MKGLHVVAVLLLTVLSAGAAADPLAGYREPVLAPYLSAPWQDSRGLLPGNVVPVRVDLACAMHVPPVRQQCEHHFQPFIGAAMYRRGAALIIAEPIILKDAAKAALARGVPNAADRSRLAHARILLFLYAENIHLDAAKITLREAPAVALPYADRCLDYRSPNCPAPMPRGYEKPDPGTQFAIVIDADPATVQTLTLSLSGASDIALPDLRFHRAMYYTWPLCQGGFFYVTGTFPPRCARMAL